MTNIIERFNYVKLERTTDPVTGIRKYTDPLGNKLPSVTTILGATKDSAGLDAWRAYVGEEKAKQITTEATNLGSLMHTHVENSLLGVERPKGNNLVRKMASDMADQIINIGLPKINEVWGIEVPLYYPGLFAGTTDLVGIYEGLPAVMDHKSANKMKAPEHVEDYFQQGAAYCMAHNEVHGTNIRKVVLFMVARNLEYKEWILEGNEFDKFYDLWLGRLEKYYA